MLYFLIDPDFWGWSFVVVLGAGLFGAGYYYGHKNGKESVEHV